MNKIGFIIGYDGTDLNQVAAVNNAISWMEANRGSFQIEGIITYELRSDGRVYRGGGGVTTRLNTVEYANPFPYFSILASAPHFGGRYAQCYFQSSIPNDIQLALKSQQCRDRDFNSAGGSFTVDESTGLITLGSGQQDGLNPLGNILNIPVIANVYTFVINQAPWLLLGGGVWAGYKANRSQKAIPTFLWGAGSVVLLNEYGKRQG